MPKRKRARTDKKDGKRRNKLSSLTNMSVFNGPEVKVVDDEANTTAVTSTPQFFLLNGLQLGDTVSAREGRMIKLNSLYFRAFLRRGTSPTVVQQAVRAIILYDKNPNAATPSVTDLLVSSNVTSHLNISNKARFIILYDDLNYIDQSVQQDHGSYRVFRKLNVPTLYNSTNNGTITDIVNGAVFLFLLGTNAETDEDVPRLVWSSRVRYTDK